MPPRQAQNRYQCARQKPHQSVRDFANYVQSLEVELDYLVTEQMRFERLWEGVFGIVLDAAGPRWSATGYEDYVDLLYAAEQRVPARLEFLER